MKYAEEIFMNKYLSNLINYFKFNEKLVDRKMVNWVNDYKDKEISVASKIKEMVDKNHSVLENVIGI